MILSKRSDKEKPFQTNKQATSQKRPQNKQKLGILCSFGNSGLLMFLFSITYYILFTAAVGRQNVHLARQKRRNSIKGKLDSFSV